MKYSSVITLQSSLLLKLISHTATKVMITHSLGGQCVARLFINTEHPSGRHETQNAIFGYNSVKRVSGY